MLDVWQREITVKESDIMFEIGRFWVCDNKRHYSVMEVQGVVSVGSEQYAHNADGLSLAIARAKYLRKNRNNSPWHVG